MDSNKLIVNSKHALKDTLNVVIYFFKP